ncbi:Methyltransferase domain-containing protein [Andreprevotia lacus DSM 23236]|uniref:Methyltransferase domain-containing protein n=2 Tax=Andreprevotia TaxID=397275 RepID=A0A1W1XYB9_9NEIS|nr:Methyltransferase domain-containing protein [Andreprevotia lacus DSM 23236]
MLETHVYEREVVGEEGDSLSHIVAMLTEPGDVLDVGTGSGALGRYLRQQDGRLIDGLTYNQAELERAQPFYRQIWLADLTQPQALDVLGERRYRYIVCADVLEHLADPETVLAALTKRLAVDGELVISIPNIGYAGVLAELLAGEFLYRNEGLLDRTHLRFFTRKSLLRLLDGAGLGATQWHSVVRPLPWSEFAPKYLDHLPPQVQRYLCAREDAHAYQFIVKAALGVDTTLQERLAPQNAPHFMAQLYWSTAAGDASFAEAASVRAFGIAGLGRQTLRFELPAGLAPLQALRIDPADRPGALELFSVRLRAQDGTVLWQWQPRDGGIDALGGMQRLPATHGEQAAFFAVFDEDPWLVLKLGQQVAAAMIEIELSWPQLPEAEVLAQAQRLCNAELARLGAESAHYRQKGAHYRQVAAWYRQEAARSSEEVVRNREEASAMAAQLRQQIAAQSEFLEHMKAQNARDLQSMQALQEELAHARGMLQGVRASKLWRLGRWLGLTKISL